MVQTLPKPARLCKYFIDMSPDSVLILWNRLLRMESKNFAFVGNYLYNSVHDLSLIRANIHIHAVFLFYRTKLNYV